MERREFFTAIASSGSMIQPPKDNAETLAILRKCYGDQAVLDALAETGGDVQRARKGLNSQRQRERRAEIRADRSFRRTDQRLFHGPVEIGEGILSLNSRAVKSSMSGRKLLRGTRQGTLTQDGSEIGTGNIIVLLDLRIGDGKATAEVVWTGSEYRVHIRRRSPADERQPVTLDIGQVRVASAPILPPLMPPQRELDPGEIEYLDPDLASKLMAEWG
jgi:hypothetical protein